jgi:hypothetical protein
MRLFQNFSYSPLIMGRDLADFWMRVLRADSAGPLITGNSKGPQIT